MPLLGSDIVYAKMGGLPATDLRLNLKAVYTDSEAATVLVRWHGQERGIPVSHATAAAIISQAQHDATITGSEGYADDATATIYWLRMLNEYARLLTSGERAAVTAFQEEVTPRRQPKPKQSRHFLTGHFRARR